MRVLLAKPLYTFKNNAKAGDIEGDGKGGVWHVAKP
jgi:predicted lipoprotein with Yx(FWY)xxD motif